MCEAIATAIAAGWLQRRMYASPRRTHGYVVTPPGLDVIGVDEAIHIMNLRSKCDTEAATVPEDSDLPF